MPLTSIRRVDVFVTRTRSPPLVSLLFGALLHLPSGRTTIVRRGTRVSLEADGEVPEEIFVT